MSHDTAQGTACSSSTACSRTGPRSTKYWDLRIWVEIDAELSVRRGVERDAEKVGDADAAETLHRERYLAAELLYLAEVDPLSFVDVIVDNTDFDHPSLLGPS